MVLCFESGASGVRQRPTSLQNDQREAFNGHATRPSDQFATNPSGFVMTSSDRITGVLSPVVTPFTSELDVDVPRFVAHCRWLLSQDCGLAFLGTNSEANSLSFEERIALSSSVGAAVPERRPMSPAPGCASIPEPVAPPRRAVAHGCAGV